MSGLIWQAVGKSISDAGAMYGKYQMSQAEDQQREARELAREERAEARKEAAAKKDADIYAAAETAAPGIGEERRFAKFKADLGETDMPEEDVRKVFDSQYNQKKTGDFEGADRYVERYSKEKEDVLNEIRRMGGSSGLINQARESQKSALTAETAADRLAFDERRDERRREVDLARIEAADKRDERRDNNRPPPKDDTEDKITRAENALSMARTRIEKSFREPTTQEKFNPQLLSAYQAERDKFVNEHPDIKRQTERLERLYGGGSAPAPARPGPTRAAASGNRPPLSQFRQP